MARVVRPGGAVAAYAWDMARWRIPLRADPRRTARLGATPSLPPSPDASREETLRDLWTAAGLEAVETREITVHRTFADFEDFWNSSTSTTGTMRATFAAMAASDTRISSRHGCARECRQTPQGRITYRSARQRDKGPCAEGGLIVRSCCGW